MSGDAFRKVTPGERFKMPAQFFNTMVDLANERNRNRNQSSESGIYGEYDPAWICVKNISASVIESGCPVKLGAKIVLPDSTSPTKEYAIECDKPSTTSIVEKKIGIIHGPINPGKMGWAIAAGVCIAKVSVGSTSHARAYAKNNDASKLYSCPTGGGFRILYAPATGDQYCLVERTEETQIRFKISSNASGGGKYNGKSVTGGSIASDTVDLAESDFGTINSTEDLLCLNVREVGKSTHDISNSTYLPLIFIGDVIGMTSDNKQIVAFDGYQWEDCPT